MQYHEDGKVAVVSLNRAKKFNAITFEMFDKLKLVFEYLGRNGSDVRIIVFIWWLTFSFLYRCLTDASMSGHVYGELLETESRSVFRLKRHSFLLGNR